MNLYRIVKGFAYLSLTSLVIATASSCTDKVGDNEFNTVKDGTTATKTNNEDTAVGLLQKAMGLVHDAREHKYQYQFNLHIDNYAGYLCVANKLEGRLSRMLSPNKDFETGPRQQLIWLAQQVVPVINSAEDLGRRELGAIASILYDFSALEMTDVYGPMPYKDHRALKAEPPITYEKVSEIYKQIFKSLAKQQQVLKDVKDQLTDKQKADLRRFKIIEDGDLDRWIKFANSIRMRMAIRISKVDPELGKAEFLSAMEDGVLDPTADKDITFTGAPKNPLYIISFDWHDTRLNANFENLLNRFKHPIREKWFTMLPAGFKDKDGVARHTEAGYVGMRSGMATLDKRNQEFKDSYDNFSAISTAYAGEPIAIFKTSEIAFLKAEAALRSWIPGSAGNFYEEGIYAFLSKVGFAIADYNSYTKLKPSDCPQIPYVDYYDDSNSLPKELCGSAELGVKWDNSLSDEKKLEMIITQKYIANYPLSLEAWSDFRRTGYPVMLPIHGEDVGDSSLPPAGWAPTQEDIDQFKQNGIDFVQPDRTIRRIPFVKSDKLLIEFVNKSGMPALIEEDTSIFRDDVQAAHIWWDVAGKGNFN